MVGQTRYRLPVLPGLARALWPRPAFGEGSGQGASKMIREAPNNLPGGGQTERLGGDLRAGGAPGWSYWRKSTIFLGSGQRAPPIGGLSPGWRRNAPRALFVQGQRPLPLLNPRGIDRLLSAGGPFWPGARARPQARVFPLASPPGGPKPAGPEKPRWGGRPYMERYEL
jgi:hypothetical protein